MLDYNEALLYLERHGVNYDPKTDEGKMVKELLSIWYEYEDDEHEYYYTPKMLDILIVRIKEARAEQE